MIIQTEVLAPAIRAGRSALGWSQSELSEKSGISLPTIVRVEKSSNPKISTVQAIFSVLKENGVDFVWKNDGFEMTTKFIVLNLTIP